MGVHSTEPASRASRNFRIVVGVDGSEGGRRALRWAITEASARGGTVQAVNAWRWDEMDLPPTASPDEGRRRAEQTLDSEIEAIRDRATRVSIASEAVEGVAADVLSSAALDADLLVLGSHGHSRVRHTVLGSVSEACIRQATCPVVVLPVSPPAPPARNAPAVPD
jgi:nucleotide-binding universal stress UspA family protein